MRFSTVHRAICALLFVVSIGCSDSDESSPNNGSTDSGVTNNQSGFDAGDDAGGDAGVSNRPLIHEAGLCEIPDNPQTTVERGTDLMTVTLDAPNAICNDGSPAIVYVRPAPAGSQNAGRWLLWLEGGGACNHPASCADRWCGTNPLFTAAKMSSRFAPEGIRGTGIFGVRPENSFSDWNHVVGYYCSSDNWGGRKRTAAIDETGATPEFDLYFHGAYIVDAMIETLKSGATSDDGTMSLPSIDEAQMVVLSGTSAGGGGARFNADRVGEMLRASNSNVEYRLVVDAGAYPNEARDPELSEADASALLDIKYDTITEWRDGVTDASCLEYHADDPRWCSDNSHLLYHHITTPWFVKMDLTDNANAPGPYADTQTFARVVFDHYASIFGGSFTPEEAGVPIGEVGLFIPNCGHHVNLEVGSFYRIEITDGTDSYNTHDVLRNWIEGAAPDQVLHNPNAGFTSVCP